MSYIDALDQYNAALKAGQKYYKAALSKGEYPYPVALDDFVDETRMASTSKIGVIDIPVSLIVGTKTAGRQSALAGNFMPLMTPETEFARKWIALCEAHISDEGIRDPIKCYEYLGRFYVQEGNKRASVLMSYGARKIPGSVTRLVPAYSDDPEIQMYYEFLHFYSLSGSYLVRFRKTGDYTRLQAALGVSEDHIWTDSERRSFSAGFARLTDIYRKVTGGSGEPDNEDVSDALLVWLQVFSFQDLKNLPEEELRKNLASLLPDIRSYSSDGSEIKVSSDADIAEQGILSRILSIGRPSHVKAAFIYAFDPARSEWTKAHEHGRRYLEEKLPDVVTTSIYSAVNHDYYSAMVQAISDGNDLIIATTPPMIDTCRRISIEYPAVKVLNCSLSLPYHGIKTVYSRIYECKFITGAIAGAMAENDNIGYVANYPIYGTMANINAFALGARATNPRARIQLHWSCTPGDPTLEFQKSGIRVISNRDAANADSRHFALEWGTYLTDADGRLSPLAVPTWNWGKVYERVIFSILSGGWDLSSSRAVNYWFGLDTGVLDIRLSDDLPSGVYSLACILTNGIREGRIDPFHTYIRDQAGTLRNDGQQGFSYNELMEMDWLADNVDGRIPEFDELFDRSKELVRLLGIYRDRIPPESREGAQL